MSPILPQLQLPQDFGIGRLEWHDRRLTQWEFPMNRTARVRDRMSISSKRWIGIAATSFAAVAILAYFSLLQWRVLGADEPAANLPSAKLLFLGDKTVRQHTPLVRYNIIKPVLAKRNITVDYTDELSDINSEKLANYDGLIVYANIDRITPEAAKALIDYVEGGKGFIPLHCASYCFRNSPEVVAMIGGQFCATARAHSARSLRIPIMP